MKQMQEAVLLRLVSISRRGVFILGKTKHYMEMHGVILVDAFVREMLFGKIQFGAEPLILFLPNATPF